MTFKLEFETDNSAFDDDRAAEMSRVLHEIAESIAGGRTYGSINDKNDYPIGYYEIIGVSE